MFFRPIDKTGRVRGARSFSAPGDHGDAVKLVGDEAA
jgi:hypothetical protein